METSRAFSTILGNLEKKTQKISRQHNLNSMYTDTCEVYLLNNLSFLLLAFIFVSSYNRIKILLLSTLKHSVEIRRTLLKHRVIVCKLNLVRFFFNEH